MRFGRVHFGGLLLCVAPFRVVLFRVGPFEETDGHAGSSGIFELHGPCDVPGHKNPLLVWKSELQRDSFPVFLNGVDGDPSSSNLRFGSDPLLSKLAGIET